MTLPFRRRHNDHEEAHDRARALTATGFLQPNEPADADWLEAHLAGCLECRTDAAAYDADRQLLRRLREQAPEPPRDLWARTAAAIEREGGRRNRDQRPARVAGAPRGWRIGRVPAGVVSGLLVVLVVVGASLVPRGGILLGPTPAGSDVGATPQSEATPIAVVAEALAWIQVAEDGTFEFRQASVLEVCPDLLARCAPLDSAMTTRLAITEPPQAVLLSPTGSQIVVVTSAASAAGTDILVVPVPAAPSPDATASPVSSSATPTAPTDTPATPTNPPTDPPTAPPTPSATPTVPPETPTPSGLPTDSPGPSASPNASAGYAIVTGVIVVGDAAYSPDGSWLAFSARPAFGEIGPDLYLWRVGDPLAVAVTQDHRTFFSGWLGGQVLANRVEPGVAPADPSALADPSAAPTPTLAPTPSPAPTPTADPNATPGPSPLIVEDHPVAFLLDPETGAATPVAGTDIWRPTVDPTGRSVVYWSGTLVPDGTGTGWSLGTGRLVLDGWQDGSPLPTDDATALPGTTAGTTPGTTAPTTAPIAEQPVATDASGAPLVPVIGPAGHPITLAEGPITGFNAWFDPSGTRLAVWVADPSDPAVGELRLVVLDPDTREIDPTTDPLPGVVALHGVSISGGRLAWVTPPGQDGEGSHLQILAWSGRDFGQIRTIQAQGLAVVR